MKSEIKIGHQENKNAIDYIKSFNINNPGHKTYFQSGSSLSNFLMGGINGILVHTLATNFDFTIFQPSHADFSWSQLFYSREIFYVQVALKKYNETVKLYFYINDILYNTKYGEGKC